MNNLNFKRVVCIISQASLDALRGERRAPLRERVWREIRVSATAEKITVTLANIDEEAATGGYCNMRESVSGFEMTWSELGDVPGIEKRVELEPWLVARHTLELLNHLRSVSTQVLDALVI